MRTSVLRGLVWVVWLSVGVAYAGNVSFTGAFTADDQVETFQFTALTATFTAQTWSYAGGTNAAATLIPAGGFDPVLSLFSATGGLLPSSPLKAENNDGAGVATDLSSGLALDSLLSFGSLTPGGTYVLVLSENDNLPNGPTYGNGFSQTGNGNFTATEFGCSASSPFCDWGVDQRDGHWAVD